MVSICILNWNCCEILKQTFHVLSHLKIKHEIIVFDQNSNDGSVAYLQDLLEKNNHVNVIFSEKNIGNSISRNIMINQAKYEYVLLIDSDITPIKNSIEEMFMFLEKNLNFSFIGYDFHNFTRNYLEATKEQKPIENTDIKVMTEYSKECCHCIPLCQYGLFRKQMLLQCPYPEFYPFNEEGWGSEDDVMGYAWKENNLGEGAIIKNHFYFHKKNSSAPLLGPDNFGKRYLIRYIYNLYFRKFLNSEQKIQALKNKILPKTKLNLNKYSWQKESNLGDVATDFILEKLFPFFEFDENNKKNLLMFGGSIFNHLNNANKKHNTQFENVIYFGTGLSCEAELQDSIKQFKNIKNLQIFARGQKTAGELSKNNIPYKAIVGDVLQLFACFNPAHQRQLYGNKCLCIKDAYSSNLNLGTFSCDKIRVAKNGKNTMVPFVNLDTFLKMIKIYNKIYSSQIHPFFISAVLGKPCELTPKDWRAEDLRFFKSLKFQMTEHDSSLLRKEIFKKALHLVDQFTEVLLPYAKI